MVRLDKFPGFNIGVAQCRPTSRGSVRVTSKDPGEHPKIIPNYLSTENDVQEMLEGVKLIRKIARTPPLQAITMEEILPGAKVTTDDELLEDIRNRSGTTFHPVGTCTMGNSPASAVVDPYLRVYSIDKLRIADASVFPSLISGNTNAPAMMVGEKAADMILEDYRASQ
jgi:choline dehydrogenase